MNRYILRTTFISLILSFTGCTPIKSTISHQYTFTPQTQGQIQSRSRHHTHVNAALLISKPDAMAGYRTEQMLYVNQRFNLAPFAKNAWTNPPADMLYPVLIERFQSSHAFRAISSSPYADRADYRLDTQLLALHQNFLFKQSRLQFLAKITLTRIKDNHVLSSRLIEENILCPSNTPYGGVLAANIAVSTFTNQTLNFVVKAIQADKGGHKI